MDENETRVRKLLDDVVEDLENMGLYSRHVNVMGSTESEEFDEDADIRTMIADGEASFAIVGNWQIGDVAWQDKILNPEAYDENKQFELMMPTEEEIISSKVQDALASGVDIFDIDLDLGSFDEDQDGA